MTIRTVVYGTAATLFLATGVQAADLSGTTFVVTNTFQGAQTENAEVDVAAFGLNNNLFATVSDGVELPVFIDIYDVDVSADAVKFTWVETDFSKKITGPTPEGNHDRNYFTFDLPEGMAITEVTFDAEASELLDGSTPPVATVLGRNRFVIDNNGGVVRGVGFNPVFRIQVSDGQKQG